MVDENGRVDLQSLRQSFQVGQVNRVGLARFNPRDGRLRDT